MRDEGYYFLFYVRKYLMRYSFILIETFLLLSGRYFIFMTFLSDAGGHLDLGGSPRIFLKTED